VAAGERVRVVAIHDLELTVEPLSTAIRTPTTES